MELLGSRMKRLRLEQGFSQKELAQELGISNVQLSRYESGDRKPDPEMIKRLAIYFNTSSDFLLGLQEEKHPDFIKSADKKPLIKQLFEDPELFDLVKKLAEDPVKRKKIERILEIIEND